MRTRYSVLPPLMVSAGMFLAVLAFAPLTTQPLVSATIVLTLTIPGMVGALMALLGMRRLPSLLLSTLAGMIPVLWVGLASSPHPHPVVGLQELFVSGFSTLRNNVLPIPASPGFEWLIAVTALLLWFMTDLLVEVLEQPAWSLVPLALPFTISTVVLPADVPLTGFLLVAGGFTAILLSSSGVRPAAAGRGFQLSRWGVGLGAAAVAVAAAAGASAALPMGPKQPWLLQGTDTPIQLGDPTLDLTRNLNRETPVDVLTYRASDGEAHYLRTTALTRLTANGAQLESMRLRASGIEGAYDAPGEKVEFDVSMQFASQYLPVPFAPDGWDAAGTWGFDQNTLSIVATGQAGSEQTSNLDYRVTSVIPKPDTTQLESAQAGSDPAGPETLKVPEGISEQVWRLLDEITAGAKTDGEAALAIQSYLNSDRFEYTLQAPNATDANSINAFLLEARAGYCVHFASSMTVLARAKGIPARIGVGFTGGTQTGDRYKVTSDNMHAWPELYFEGLGWISFEPTKGFGSSSTTPPPGSTSSQPPETAPPSESPNPEESATQSTAPSPSPSPTPSPSLSEQPQPPATSSGGDSGGGWLPLILLTPFCLLIPAGARTALRGWRLRSGQTPQDLAAGAWQEVAAIFRDLGMQWRTGSPVETARQMGNALPPPADTHLKAIADTVQRCQFARQAPPVDQLPNQVRALRKGLLPNAPFGRRIRAFLLPASLLPQGAKDRRTWSSHRTPTMVRGGVPVDTRTGGHDGFV